MMVPIVIAFAAPVVSFVLFAFVAGAFIAATMLGRWELVVLWPVRHP